MGRFQQGDQVTARDFGLVGIVLDPEPNDVGRVKVNWPGGAVAMALESALFPADVEPSVPDADGNPIRPGQLVESTREKADPNYWTLSPEWVEDVKAAPDRVRINGYWVGSESLRVVVDTFRPPTA